MVAASSILDVQELSTWFGSRRNPVRAVDGVSFRIPHGECVALVGESGCGKSVTALSIARLVPQPPGFYAGGRILLDGMNVMELSEQKLAAIRGGDVSYIFQEPATALNPVFKIGTQVSEAIRLHRPGVDARAETVSMLARVGLPNPERISEMYPHQVSGGMQQRVMIAMALVCHPKLLVADEPTTALDVTIQAQILDLLKTLQSELHMAVLLITHNLGLVADMAKLVNVMYAGRIVESGAVEIVLTSPAHPYTRGLIDAVPRVSAGRGIIKGIDGSVPNPSELPPGCRFAPRCPKAQDVCRSEEPGITTLPNNRTVRCHFPCT